jgi:ATP-dependent DNA helicase PIF1
MKFIRWLLPLRLVFAGTIHWSHGMTLQQAMVDCRTEFWEHGQLYVGLSRVTSPTDLCILLPPNMSDFAIRPPVDMDGVNIIETLNRSGPTPTTPPLAAQQVYLLLS